MPEASVSDLRELLEYPYRIIHRSGATSIEVVTIVHGRQDLIRQAPS